MKKFTFILTLALLISNACFASNNEKRLFHFERSVNSAIMCYDVNLNGDKLDMKKPVYIYWAHLEDPYKKTSESSYIDRTMAFGFKIKSRGNNEVTGHLTASNKLSIRVCKYKGKWVAMCNIKGRQAILKRMYVKMKSSITADYVDAFGIATDNGEEISVRFKN